MTEESSNDFAMDSEVAGDAENTDLGEAVISTERKLIHRAYLHLRVDDYEVAQANIEQKTAKYEGYIVESTVYHDELAIASGVMSVRIPAQHFQAFLLDTEKEAKNIIERNVTGEDVTEQYIDLEAKLKAKQIVEERLIGFMNEAEKTEDLLQISSDLAVVQEEIDSLIGKLTYLKNQTEYATIDISLVEDGVKVPEIGANDLDTWEKTKKQFLTSINFLLAFGSGLLVFIVGNLPVLVILLGVGSGIYIFARRQLKKKKE